MNIFEHLMIEKIERFKAAYLSTSRSIFYDQNKTALIHPGEFGVYRESVVKELIRFFIPYRLSINTGFVISTDGSISTQSDLVIFDYYSTPLIESDDRQRFFPAETVVAVFEVKSVLSKNALREALHQLAKTKAIRETLRSPSVIRRQTSGSFSPKANPYDQIGTFLICQKLDFQLNNISEVFNTLYDESVPARHRHNAILSIEDGLFVYKHQDKTFMYPFIRDVALKNRFVQPTENPYCHFKLFCSFLFMVTSSATILYPEMVHYMGTITGGLNHDET